MEDSKKLIYFDNAASTPLFPEVIDEYVHFLTQNYSNPSASHKAGLEIRQRLNDAGRSLLNVLATSADAAQVVWTSGGTEANNLAIFGHANTHSNTEEFSATTSLVEHDSVFKPFKRLESRGAKISWSNVDEMGHIDFDHLSRLINEKTELVSICHVQNETGVTQDLVKIRELMNVKSPKAKLHVDGIQSFGKIEVPWEAAKIDMLSISSHKSHGPGGIGALIVRNSNTKLQPIFEGGGQQNNVRSGSIDSPSAIAFFEVCVAFE